MSFNIALSGIQAVNEQLNSISNNIANASTYGYKAQRANFSSMYAGSQPTGVQVGSTTQNIGLSGGVLSTGRSLDASINGRGFFVSKTGSGETVYSRVGIFTKDGSDFLVDSAGRRVQGNQLTPGVESDGVPGDIKVPTQTLKAKPTTEIDFAANLSADWKKPAIAFDPAAPDPASYNMTKVTLAYDSQGKSHTVSQYFARTDDATNSVAVYTLIDGQAPSAGTGITLTFDQDGKLTNDPTTLAMTYDPAPAAEMNITLDYVGTTFQAGEATTSVNIADGYTTGQYVGVELASDGKVVAKYSNGEQQAVGQIKLATFSNEDALIPVSDTSWTANGADVGTVSLDNPGKSVAGSLSTATLEGSNVDITSELVGLMGSQRNYQANSKVITTENQMLQSLMQAM
ncbi:flagellar hook protein FlgE [Pseudoduganella albidiflava]|uniref:Flagellar hook protein FlgE n=1 Tax=Pseudoduganella albidiflava TaxID=321983 RepID=A0A411WW92_9BURK|nr:flagellar hook-basal body complex protein [Pseudoduganella albidiflava]QBI01061.1 flagellar hook-basal body complex protein [Pseudoduganella albidiflava]GGY47789.1 flagellar hook protein FlgE [Pseudoduganella albidiflava]